MSANSGAAAQLGIALDGTLLTAVWRAASVRESSSTPWRTLIVPCDGTAESIATALREVAAEAPPCDEIAVTLLRPLAATRAVAFPAMRRAELEAVLERDWARYVIGLRAEPHVAAVRSVAKGVWRAAFAPLASLEALDAAARSHGWAMRDVRTTEDALASAALEALPTVARMDDAIIVLCGVAGATDIALLQLGTAVAGRQLLTGSAAEVATFTRQTLGRVNLAASAPAPARSAAILICGDAARAEALAAELGRDGLRAQYAQFARFASESPAALLAAAALGHPAALPFVSPTERTSRLHRARVATRWLVAATVLLVIGGFAIENGRLTKQLNAVAQQRAAIAPSVSAAIARRTQLESATDAATALAEYEAGASHAGATVATIALLLPDNASLSVLQVSGDSVTIEGESDRSADVYDALRKSPVLESVRLAAPLRQERQADDATVERFSFVARLRRGTAR